MKDVKEKREGREMQIREREWKNRGEREAERAKKGLRGEKEVLKRGEKVKW